jgi:hypothetical protein
MPVRIEGALAAPQLQSTRVGMPKADPRAAAAPARSLGSLAQSIASIAEPFQQHAEQVQKFEDTRVESETLNRWAQESAQHQLDLEQDPDPQSRITKTRDFLTRQKGEMEGLEMTPAVRQRLTLRFDDYASNTINKTGANAAMLERRRAADALDARMRGAFEYNNEGELEDVLRTGMETNLILPGDAEKHRMEFRKKQASDSELRTIHADPGAWLDQNKPDAIPQGVSPAEYTQRRNLARQLVAQETAETSGNLMDAIVAGKITTPEQVENLAGNLRPTAKAKLLDFLKEQGDEAFRAKRATPEYQDATVGKALDLLDRYQLDDDHFDEKFVEIDGLVRSLPEGSPARAELRRKLDAARDGQLGEIKDHADLARQALKDAHKAGRFGNTEGVQASQSLRSILDDGILTDATKLQRLGFDAKQAKAIAAGKQEKDRLALFRTTFDERKGTDQTSPFERAAFLAIRDGMPPSHMVEITDDSGREKTWQNYGRAQNSLEQWLKVNPKASPEQITEKVKELGGQADSQSLRQSLFKSRPSGVSVDGSPGVLPPRETSQSSPPSDTRITSYGYPDDETPDTNSANGIGSFTTRADALADRSAETRLRPGDIAVSPDVERELTAAGVKPRDEITVTLADGTTHRGRWMDRTSSSLTGRIDLYSPEAKDARSGKKVVGWSI